MESKIILHIGMQRTGTTFFQHEVFPRLNIRYITPSFFKYGEIGTLAQCYNFIVKEDTLISNENIYCDMWSQEDDRYTRLYIIKKLFPRAKIIFGVREKESLKKSWYKKSIGVGAVWSYDEFLSKINMEFFKYEEYIEGLKEMFKDVYVYKYEEFKKDPRKIIERMCEFMEVEVPEIEEKAFKRRWNIGYSKRQIKIARILNKIFKTRLNPQGIFPLDHTKHPHRIIFQRDIIFKLQGKKTVLPPVYHSKYK